MRPSADIKMFFLPAALLATGCGGPQVTQPISQAPPVMSGAQQAYNAPGQMGAAQPQGGSAGVYQWQDAPPNQQVPITGAAFDQGGYQIFAQSGETIVVPFVNQSLYVMKFGQTNGPQPYFVNEGNAPVLYLQRGGFLQNSSPGAQGARWYPFSENYAYTSPVYVGLAPTWSDYVGMGWYPGMHYYGGLWGYNPYHPVWMPGFYISIGGSRYNNYNSYRSYYTTHTNYAPLRSAFNYRATNSTGSFGSGRSSSGFGRSTGSTGSFGGSRRTFGGTGSSGSGFGNSGRSATGSTGSFGGRRSGTAFGGGSSSFGGSSSGRSSFGGSTPGSFNTPRSSGSSFGRSSSSGSSFGGGRSSGSSSFGGGRSSGSSFGGGRRR